MLFREKIEWSQLYWYDTDAPELPRIMLIGDSIVCGHGPELARILKGKATVAWFATSRIVGDPAYARELGAALADAPVDLIEFNNGLHGFKYGLDFYREHLAMTVDHLQNVCRAKIRWRNSTPIVLKDDPAQADPEKNAVVIARNQAAAEVMAERNIPVDDLYTPSLAHPSWHHPGDTHHYNKTGRTAQAKILAKIFTKNL